jgi:hypothetical protein
VQLKRHLTGKLDCLSGVLNEADILDSVSLKTKVAATDLHRLIMDARRRIDFEFTFEGAERRVK